MNKLTATAILLGLASIETVNGTMISNKQNKDKLV